MSTLKVNELDTESGTTITVAAGKTLAGTDIIGSTQIAANAVDTSEIAANAVTLAEMAGLARGKLIVGDASGDPSALTVGTTGQYLTSDGSDVSWGAVTSLPTQTGNVGKILTTDGTDASWTPTAGRNILINGGMDAWQYGTAFTTVSYYQWYADRWNGDAFNSSLFSVWRDTLTSLPFPYFLRFNRPSGQTGTEGRRIGQVMETNASKYLAGHVVTLTFYAKVDANYSPATNVCTSKIFTGTGTDETTANGLGSAWTGYATQDQSNTMTTSWLRFTHTVTIPAAATQLGVQFTVPAAVGTAGAADTWDIGGFKLEVGSQPTPFINAPIAETMAECYRFFETSYNNGTKPAVAGPTGAWFWRWPASGAGTNTVYFKTEKRVTPTMVSYSRHAGTSGKVTNMSGGASDIATNAVNIGTKTAAWNYTSTGSETYVEAQWTASAEL